MSNPNDIYPTAYPSPPVMSQTYPQQQPQLSSPPPVSTAAISGLGSRYVRSLILVAASVIFVLVLYNLLPGLVAQSVRAAYPRVQAVISGVQTGGQIKAGQSVTLSATGSVGKDLTYLWTFDDGSTSNQPTLTKTFDSPAHGTSVTLAVSDPLYGPSGGADHISQTSITLTVLPPPPTASFTATPDSFGYVSFDASGSMGSNLQYQWDFGDPSSGTANIEASSYDSQPYHYYANTTAATYTVTLTVTDDYGQTATTTQQVTVTPGS